MSGPFVPFHSVHVRGSILLESKIRSRHIYKSEEVDAECVPLVYQSYRRSQFVLRLVSVAVGATSPCGAEQQDEALTAEAG